MNGKDGFEYTHYVFSTRRRAPVFDSPELAAKLHELIVEIARGKGFELDEFEIMPDHIHLLIRRRLSDSHSYIMKSFKGIAARRIFQFEPLLKFDLEAHHLWARGYWIERVPSERLNAVRTDIRNQKKAHYGRAGQP